jgi:hypothetical protein
MITWWWSHSGEEGWQALFLFLFLTRGLLSKQGPRRARLIYYSVEGDLKPTDRGFAPSSLPQLPAFVCFAYIGYARGPKIDSAKYFVICFAEKRPQTREKDREQINIGFVIDCFVKPFDTNFLQEFFVLFLNSSGSTPTSWWDC